MSEQPLPEKQPDNKKVKLGWLHVFKSTMMAFLGVQREVIREQDFEHGNPIHFIIMGISMTILFVIVLIAVVKVIFYFAGVQ
jgi:uncharacterized membrane protein YhdT